MPAGYRRWKSPRTWGLAVVAAWTLSAATAATQSASADTSAKPGFDITRFSTAGNDWFETFHVKETQPLRQARDAAQVTDDTRVLVIETAAGMLALLTDQMSFHHIAQGHAGGKDWMATF